MLGCAPFFTVPLDSSSYEFRVSFLEPRAVDIEVESKPWRQPPLKVTPLLAARLHSFLMRPNPAWPGCTNWQAAIIVHNQANREDSAPEGGFHALTRELMERQPTKFRGCLPIDLSMPDYGHLLASSPAIKVRVPLPEDAVLVARNHELDLTLAVAPCGDAASLPEFLVISGTYGMPSCQVWHLSFSGARCLSATVSHGLDKNTKVALMELLRRKVGPYSNWERLVSEWNAANSHVWVTDTRGDRYEVVRREGRDLLPPDLPMPDFTRL